MSGVYIIYNEVTNMFYIGSSINIPKRLKEHRRNLTSGSHCNSRLQNAYNKYGDNAFTFEVLEECSSDIIRYIENFWITMTECYKRGVGYNLDKTSLNIGSKMSDETKAKLRIAATGRIMSRETVENIRIKNLGQSRPSQSQKMKDHYDKVGYSYLGFNNMSNEKKAAVSIKLSISTTKRYSNPVNRLTLSTKPISSTSDSGDTVYFVSLHSAATYYNIDRGAIKYALNNTNGYVKKVSSTFKYVSHDEYIVNKVAGEK